MKLNYKIQILSLLFCFCCFCGISQPLPKNVKEKYDKANTDLDKRQIIFRFLYTMRDDSSIIPEAGKLTKYFQNRNDQATLDYIQLALSIYLSHVGDYNAILNGAIDILSRSEIRKDNYGKMLANRVISLAYYTAGDLEKTIFYDKKMLEYAKVAGNTEELSQGYNNLGSDFTDYGHPDSGLVYLQRSLEYAQMLQDSAMLSNSLGSLGANYYAQKKYDSAIAIFNISLPLSKTTDILSYVWNLNDLTQIYIALKKWDSAKIYAADAVRAAKSKNLKPQLLRAYNNLYTCFQVSELKDSSLKYLQLIVQIKDELFSADKTKQLQAINLNEQIKQQKIEQQEIAFQNKLKLYSLAGVILLFFIVGLLLVSNNRKKQKTNKLILGQKLQVENALSTLKATQVQLIQSEKMASLGELTAGIAHEIQNPLNFVNNFSEVSNELIDEMNVELDKGDIAEAKAIAADVKQNLEKIYHHGHRAADIVKGMLQHSRNSSGVKEPTDINALCDEYLRLSYHGLRAKDKSFNATLKTDFDNSIGNINIIPQDIGRVILNLINNAFYAVDEKKKSGIENFEPTVSVSTKKVNDKVEIKVSDNGNGIPQKVLDKIFQPFFTTKPTGQGTGLGLSLSYDIIKAHGGEIKVETKEGEGTEFVIQIAAKAN